MDSAVHPIIASENCMENNSKHQSYRFSWRAKQREGSVRDQRSKRNLRAPTVAKTVAKPMTTAISFHTSSRVVPSRMRMS